jgi:hypothetical protein
VKLFYLINEPVLNYQAGYRKTIQKLIGEGDLSDCFFYSFYVKKNEFDLRRDLVIKDLTKEIIEFKPDAILFAHTGDFSFDDIFFREIERGLGYKPVYALDERDVYGKLVKKLPLELLKLSSKCDVTFLVCSGGWMFQKFEKYNRGRSVYLPHVCDDIHFGKGISNGTTRKYDVIMIGNLAKSRVPFKSMPGVRQRIKVAEALYKRHGNRFAMFGSGWDKYPFVAGQVPFFEQEQVLHSSHLSVGVDHFLSYEQYFSDRLPIALVSGVPHLSWKTPKLNLLFTEGEHICFFQSIDELLKKADAILSASPDLNSKMTSQAISLVKSRYTETIRMKKLIGYLNDARTGI